MPFHQDQKYAREVGEAFGSYLTTYTSPTGQARAVLFRKNGRVDAYVSFPPGVFASGVSDPYYSELWQYAREQGYEHFHIMLS